MLSLGLEREAVKALLCFSELVNELLVVIDLRLKVGLQVCARVMGVEISLCA
jgi:hypothetical protein